MRTPWVRLDARITEDPRICSLRTHEARWAFIVAIGKAKQQSPEGGFQTRAHAIAALGDLGKHVRELISAGLLQLNDDGTVIVRGWADWQTDIATSTERMRRLRERRRHLSVVEK